MAHSEVFEKRVRLRRFSGLAFALIAVGFTAYAVTAYAGFRGVREMADVADSRQRALEQLLLAERTLTTLVDLETGQRGFILTGRDEYLQPFVAARVTLDALRPSLRRALDGSDHGPVRALSDNIDALIADRVGQAERAIDRRREEGYDLARELDEHVKGRQVMDELRRQFDTLQSFQSALVERRNLESRDVASGTSRLVGYLAAGGTVLMIGALGLLRFERQLRDDADRAVRKAHDRLEHQVIERTAALSEAMGRIQSFAGELDLHVEEERRRLSREVHDQLGQIITAAKIVVAELVRARPDLPVPTVKQLLGLLDEAIQTARRIAGQLRPPMLDDLGLSAAVTHHVEQVAALGKLDTDVTVSGDERLTPACANQLFRILQEATTNVLRHARAATLSVHGRVDGKHYRFDIDDDGRGPQGIRPDASGVRNMHERASLVGGSLQFGPGPLGGTRVTVLIPWEPDST